MTSQKRAIGREEEMLMAVLGPEDERREAWNIHFCGLRVPVTAAEPQMTILPNCLQVPCYFVNMSIAHGLAAHIKRALQEDPHREVLYSMIDEGIFPIVAEGVTVVRAPWSIWTG